MSVNPFTNPLNRSMEERMRRRVANRAAKRSPEDAVVKRILTEEIQRRIAEYKERFGEDPEL